MNSKEFYRSYQADDKLSDLSRELIKEVLSFEPIHVLDFGAGTGKHLAPLHAAGICTIGFDISPMNVYKAIHKYDLPWVICSDESYLRNLCNVDVVMTCSALDHIEYVDDIIDEFKRIANKAIVIAEADYFSAEFYYQHDYYAAGFDKTGFKWVGEDGATYHVWKWEKEQFPVKDEAFNILSK